MYHVNPAVTKSMLLKLGTTDLIQELNIIEQYVQTSEPGTNRRRKFIHLYQFTLKLILSKNQLAL